MNTVFDTKRFGKYLTYDLNNARNSYGRSLLILALLPAIIFFFTEFFSLLFSFKFTSFDSSFVGIGFVIGLLVIYLTAPVKIYGALTEKKQGTDWLMIPASSFEKFLSMVIVMCVVLPLAYFAGFFACDLILSLVPGYDGSFTIDGFDAVSGFLAGMSSSEFVSFSKPGLLGIVWVNWIVNILIFTLGAICFKKRKVANTILCYFAFSILMMVIIVLIAGPDGYRMERFMEHLDETLTPDKLEFWINFIANAVNIIEIAAVGTALYFRIKTMKH